MLEQTACVAYTVIAKREDGKLMFLVEQNNAESVFPLTAYKGSGTGLASVIEEIKDTLDLDIDQLELAELINMIIEEQRIPLFVFNYQEDAQSLERLVSPSSELKWQASDHFTETLKKYDLSGVPNFDHD